MNAMVEAAFQYRSLYLLCTRTLDMLIYLSEREDKRGDPEEAQRFLDEAHEVAEEARKWYTKWEHAGGPTHAPLKEHLPLRSSSLAEVRQPDLSNVIVFPVERCRRSG